MQICVPHGIGTVDFFPHPPLSFRERADLRFPLFFFFKGFLGLLFFFLFLHREDSFFPLLFFFSVNTFFSKASAPFPFPLGMAEIFFLFLLRIQVQSVLNSFPPPPFPLHPVVVYLFFHARDSHAWKPQGLLSFPPPWKGERMEGKFPFLSPLTAETFSQFLSGIGWVHRRLFPPSPLLETGYEDSFPPPLLDRFTFFSLLFPFLSSASELFANNFSPPFSPPRVDGVCRTPFPPFFLFRPHSQAFFFFTQRHQRCGLFSFPIFLGQGEVKIFSPPPLFLLFFRGSPFFSLSFPTCRIPRTFPFLFPRLRWDKCSFFSNQKGCRLPPRSRLEIFFFSPLFSPCKPGL